MKNKYIFTTLFALFTVMASSCQTRSAQTTAQKEITLEDSAETNSNSDISDASVLAEDNNASAETDAPITSEVSAAFMEEQTLLEYEGLSLKALSWDPDTANLIIQAQNSSAQDYTIQFSDTSVNNYMVEPNFSMNVKADAQAEKNAEFSLDDFDSCGIEEATQIQTKILLLDSVSYDTIYTSDYITIQTGDSDKQQIFDESGEILYDQDGLKLISKGFVDDPEWGKLWKIYISNDTEEDLCIYSPDVTLNDHTMDVLFSSTVPAGKKAVSSMTVFQSDLDNYQINEIYSAQFTLYLKNPATFETIQTIDNISLGNQ